MLYIYEVMSTLHSLWLQWIRPKLRSCMLAQASCNENWTHCRISKSRGLLSFPFIFAFLFYIYKAPIVLSVCCDKWLVWGLVWVSRRSVQVFSPFLLLTQLAEMLLWCTGDVLLFFMSCIYDAPACHRLTTILPSCQLIVCWGHWK